MKKLILKAQHWQIFVLIFGLPMLGQIVMSATMFTSMTVDDPNLDMSNIMMYGVFFGAISLLSFSVILGWIWSVALGLQPDLPADVQMKTTRFKLLFFFPLLYFMVLAILTLYFFRAGFEAFVDFSPAFIVILPLHLFAMFCMLYCMYFAAKTYKTVELQREVKFGDFVGEFFLVWFLFIGVWIMQPKINEMFGKKFDFKDSLV